MENYCINRLLMVALSRIFWKNREMNEKRKWPKIKQRTEDRAKDERKYLKRVKVWKQQNPWCGGCAKLFTAKALESGLPGITTECHHMAGRQGALLLDERYWLPVCKGCHTWITANAERCFEIGLRIRLRVSLDLPGMDPTPRVFH